MLCKNNMANIDYKSKRYNAKHIFPSFPFFFFLKNLFKKKNNKTPYHEMHECYTMQILKKKKQQQQQKNGHKEYRDEA